MAVENASAAGTIVVAASGNSGPEAYVTGSPASAQSAISVAAMDARPSFPQRADRRRGAQPAADYAGVQPGDVVVSVRGVCPRVDRATLAQEAGAARPR